MSNYNIEIDNKKFKVICDLEGIRQEIESLRNGYEEDSFVPYYETSNYLTEDEYMENVDDFESNLENINLSYCERIVQSFPKKKNGMFCKGRIDVIANCDNCEFITEWHNTWIYKQMRFVSINENTLELELYKKVDTPC